MNDQLSSQLYAELSDRFRDAAPDLDRLAVGAIASGRRRRTVRRAGFALVGVAAAAGVGAFGAVVAGGDDGPAEARDPGWAAGPTTPDTPALEVGLELDLGNGLTGTVTDDKTSLYELGASTLPGPGRGFVVVVDGPTQRINDWWSAGFDMLTVDYPGITVAVSMADADALGMLGKTDEAPATPPDGWTCEWFLVDDKASCVSDDGGDAGLVIRDAKDRAAWLGSTDKGDDPDVYTTEAHDGIFISVQGGRGTTSAELRELGEGLVWTD